MITFLCLKFYFQLLNELQISTEKEKKIQKSIRHFNYNKIKKEKEKSFSIIY